MEKKFIPEKIGEFTRQGDVYITRLGENFIERISNYEKKLKIEKKEPVLAYGEITGHSHKVKNKNDAELYFITFNPHFFKDIFIENEYEIFKNYYGYEEIKILRVKKNTEVVHEEHLPHYLPVGDYLIDIQLEYDYLRDLMTNVTD